MGAYTFMVDAEGKTPDEAFQTCREQALYYGHSGYTGTIAEKDCFTMIQVPKDKDPIKYADKLLDDNDGRIDDKWGPAGCICVGPVRPESGINRYLFFGWASC